MSETKSTPLKTLFIVFIILVFGVIFLLAVLTVFGATDDGVASVLRNIFLSDIIVDTDFDMQGYNFTNITNISATYFYYNNGTELVGGNGTGGVVNDTNETIRVEEIVYTNCTGQVLIGFNNNGTGICEADDTGSFNDTNETVRMENIANFSCAGDKKVSSFEQNGTPVCTTDQEGSFTDTNASTACNTDEVLLGNGTCYSSSNFAGTNYFPSAVNLTLTTHTGNLSNGSFDGYAGANAICNQSFAGSHLCTENEVANWYANEDFDSTTGDGWVIAGGAKYIPATVPVNDCKGWTWGSAGTYLGNYWHFDITTGGDARALNCGSLLKLACCSY